MIRPQHLTNLYSYVVQREKKENGVSSSDLRRGFQEIIQAYSPDSIGLLSSKQRTVDYNVVANRCAYTFKYSPIHTAMAYEFFVCALRQRNELDRNLRVKLKLLKICCLGGGPGADMIGVLSALQHYFGFIRASVTVVDNMSQWVKTLNLITYIIKYGNYGTLSQNFHAGDLDWSFLTADLLEPMKEDLKKSISDADIITMVKFLSAAASMDTESMVEEIFTTMKPGALVFFIDNAAGGFHELLDSVANKCNLRTVFGPLLRAPYFYPRFNNTSCCKATVAVHILEKRPVVPGGITVELHMPMEKRPVVPGGTMEELHMPMEKRPVVPGGTMEEFHMPVEKRPLSPVGKTGELDTPTQKPKQLEKQKAFPKTCETKSNNTPAEISAMCPLYALIFIWALCVLFQCFCFLFLILMVEWCF